MTTEADSQTSQTSDAPTSGGGLEGVIEKWTGALRDLVTSHRESFAEMMREQRAEAVVRANASRKQRGQIWIAMAVLLVPVAALAIACSVLVAKSFRNAERIAELTVAVGDQGDDIRAMRTATEQTSARVEDFQEEAAAAPRIEVTPPMKKGGAPGVKLVVPARPAVAAKDATRTAPSASAAAAVPAVELPLTLPAGVTATTGGGS